MIDIIQTDQGIIVNKRLCLTSQGEKQSDFVTLGLTCGEDVIYGEVQKKFINYPGEYQQDNYIVYCIMSKDGLLNYVIKGVDLTFAYVQDPKAVNASAFEGVTDIIASNESTYTQLQKLDLQCNIISL